MADDKMNIMALEKVDEKLQQEHGFKLYHSAKKNRTYCTEKEGVFLRLQFRPKDPADLVVCFVVDKEKFKFAGLDGKWTFEEVCRYQDFESIADGAFLNNCVDKIMVKLGVKSTKPDGAPTTAIAPAPKAPHPASSATVTPKKHKSEELNKVSSNASALVAPPSAKIKKASTHVILPSVPISKNGCYNTATGVTGYSQSYNDNVFNVAVHVDKLYFTLRNCRETYHESDDLGRVDYWQSFDEYYRVTLDGKKFEKIKHWDRYNAYAWDNFVFINRGTQQGGVEVVVYDENSGKQIDIIDDMITARAVHSTFKNGFFYVIEILEDKNKFATGQFYNWVTYDFSYKGGFIYKMPSFGFELGQGSQHHRGYKIPRFENLRIVDKYAYVSVENKIIRFLTDNPSKYDFIGTDSVKQRAEKALLINGDIAVFESAFGGFSIEAYSITKNELIAKIEMPNYYESRERGNVADKHRRCQVYGDNYIVMHEGGGRDAKLFSVNPFKMLGTVSGFLAQVGQVITVGDITYGIYDSFYDSSQGGISAGNSFKRGKSQFYAIPNNMIFHPDLNPGEFLVANLNPFPSL